VKHDPADFPDRVRKIRERLNLSQEELARELDISFSTVNRWENRKTIASKLARNQFEQFYQRKVEEGALSDE